MADDGHAVGALCVFDPAPAHLVRVRRRAARAAGGAGGRRAGAGGAERRATRRAGWCGSWPSTPPGSAPSTGTSSPASCAGTTGCSSCSASTARRSPARSTRFNAAAAPRRPAAGHRRARQAAIESCGELRRGVPDRAARTATSAGSPPGAGRSATATGRRSGCSARRTTPRRSQDGEARVARVLEAMPTAFFSARPDVAVHLRQRRGRAAARQPPRGAGRRRPLGAVPGRGRQRLRDATTGGAVGDRAPVVASRPTTPRRSTPGTRCAPGRAPTGCRSTSSTSPRGGAPRSRLERAAPARRALLADVTSRADRHAGRSRRRSAGSAALVVPALADWCVVTLVDEDARPRLAPALRDVGCWHADPRLRPVASSGTPSRGWPRSPTTRCLRGRCGRASRRGQLRRRPSGSPALLRRRRGPRPAARSWHPTPSPSSRCAAAAGSSGC